MNSQNPEPTSFPTDLQKVQQPVLASELVLEMPESAMTKAPESEQTPVDDPKPEQQPKVEEAVSSKKIDSLDGMLPKIVHDFKKHNVTLSYSTVSNTPTNVYDVVAMPSSSASAHEELIRSIPNVAQLGNAADVNWARTFMASPEMSPADSALDASLSREGSQWRQGLEINGDLIRSVVPRFPAPQGVKLEGERALQAAYTHMQIGDIFYTGLFNSGFWVSFKPAPDAVWVAINRQLGHNVMGIDRQTYGLLHSTATSLAISTIIDSILPYVYMTSVPSTELPFEKIPEYLSNLDEHDFIWGFISANYPRGFNIERACIADASNCRHVIKETLMVRELQIVDNSALTDFHKQHMRQRAAGSMSLKSVIEYQEKLAAANDCVVTIESASGSQAQITFTVPSSAKKARMSDNYVEDVKAAVLKSVTADSPMNLRGAIYDEQMTATEMRMYQHWVKSIQLGDNTIEGEDDIADVLSTWTRDATLRTQFFDKITEFIDKNAITVIGLEAATCPNCGQSHSHPDQKLRGHIDYIPLDLIQLFSRLAEFKARLVQARA